MLRSGAVTLKDLVEPDGPVHLTIVCAPCAREGRYLVSRMIAQHGDMGLPDVLALMTQDCPKHQTVAIHDRCNAVFKP